MFVEVLIALFSIIIQPTTHHYIGELDDCTLSKICNHTWVPFCGQDKTDLSKRFFLDECDLHEYNCDNKKSYVRTDDRECSTNCTQKDHPILTTTSMAPTPEVSTVTNGETSESSIITSTTVSDTTSVKTDKATIFIDSTTTSIAETKSSPNEISTEATKTTIMETVITTKATIPTVKETEPTTVTTAADNIITKEIEPTSETTVSTTMTTVNTTKATIFVMEATIPITETTIQTTKEIVPVTNATETTPNTKTETQISQTVNIKKNEDENTIPQDTTPAPSVATTPKHNPCEHCNLPSTWETTVKGETRDFAQILRERFGNRIKFLRHTTHFPKEIMYVRRGVTFIPGHNLGK